MGSVGSHVGPKNGVKYPIMARNCFFGEGWWLIIVLWWPAVKRLLLLVSHWTEKKNSQGWRRSAQGKCARTHSCSSSRCGFVLSCEPSLPYTTAGLLPVEADAGAHMCTHKKSRSRRRDDARVTSIGPLDTLQCGYALQECVCIECNTCDATPGSRFILESSWGRARDWL